MIYYIEVVAAARETVGKMLSQRSGQRFQCVVTTNGGKTAAASRNGTQCTLDLPSLAADTVLTRAEADRMVAYLVHEVCHVLHTDYSAWRDAVDAGSRVRHWTNALEDVRIEAHEIKVGPYKAMRGLISGLVSHLYAENHSALAAEGKTLGSGMLNAPYIVTVLGRAANKYDLPTTKPLAGQLAPNVRTVVTRALEGVRTCKSTWDCLKLARELVALEAALKPPQQPQQPDAPKPPQQPQQQGQGQGDDGQGDDDQGDAGDDQGDQEGEGGNAGARSAQEGDQDPSDDSEGDQGAHGEGDQGDKEGGKSDQGDKEGETNGQPGGTGAGEKSPHQADEGEPIEPDLNLGKTADNICDRTGQDANPNRGGHILNNAIANRTTQQQLPAITTQDAQHYLNLRTPKNGVLHGQIGRLLVSEARTTSTHHETSGRLDRRALSRMQTGAPDVFTRRDFAPGVDTAVMLLIDMSGSMTRCIELAKATAWAIACAADSAGGKLCIAGFKGAKAHATLCYVKDWHQTPSQCAGLLCSMIPNNFTPLSSAIVAGARDLEAQTATRRIMLVLTDGQCDLGADAVQSACRLAANMGVETVGIGLDCEKVVKSFPPRYSVNVENLDQLAKTGLGTLVRMLEDAGAR